MNLKDKNLNILLITGRSDMGGGPRHMVDLLRSLKKLYPNNKFYSASPNDLPFGQFFKTESREHISIPSRSFSLIKFIYLLIFCKTRNIDIIHSHGRAAGLYSRLLGLFGPKVVHTFHGAHSDSSLIGKIKLLLDQILTPLTDVFICVSKSEQRKAIALKMAIPEQTIIIPNGIDLSLIEKNEPIDLHLKYGIPANKKIWGSLTRLSYEKGNDLLLDSIADSKDFNPFFFLVAGDGPDKGKLEQKLCNLGITQVKFIGQIDNPIGFLKGLDGFFSFSRGEGLPYSVIEALNCGIPCVLSKVVGHTDFDDKVQLFDPKDPLSFSQMISSSPKKSEIKINLEYSLEAMTNSIFKTYQIF